jgi:hypothetical protein
MALLVKGVEKGFEIDGCEMGMGRIGGWIGEGELGVSVVFCIGVIPLFWKGFRIFEDFFWR